MIIGLDLETTGLKIGDDRIIEMSLGVYSDGMDLIRFVTMRFNPHRSIDPKAAATHHIKMEDLMDAPDFETKAKTISQVLSKAKLIVIHNSKFDAPFLAYQLRMSGAPVPTVPVYDTMAESRWATFDGKVPTLGELCWAMGVSYSPKEAHAAEYDVDCMMKCFRRLGKFMNNKTTPFDEIQNA